VGTRGQKKMPFQEGAGLTENCEYLIIRKHMAIMFDRPCRDSFLHVRNRRREQEQGLSRGRHYVMWRNCRPREYNVSNNKTALNQCVGPLWGG
jgi:hypothetical protein